MCRNAAIKKAMRLKKEFGGFCINGVYEYIHPVIINDYVACIIYIGNIFFNEQCPDKFKKYYNVSPIKFRKNKGIQAINK